MASSTPVLGVSPSSYINMRRTHDRKEDLDERRDFNTYTCCNPGCNKKTTGHKTFKVCGRCKIFLYCSRECQVKSWPAHKLRCFPETAPKLMKNVFPSTVLQTYLTTLLILKLGLLNAADARERRHIGIEVFMIPEQNAQAYCPNTQTLDYESLAGTRGILHMHRTFVTPWNELPEQAVQMADELRKELDERGQPHWHVVLLETTGGNSKAQPVFMPFHVPGEVVESMKAKGGFETLNPDAGLTPINEYILHDTGNHLKLRANMTERDLGILRSAGECHSGH